MTRSTSGISNPLAATSVAIRIFFSLALKEFKHWILLTYDIWPFIGTVSNPKALHIRDIFKDVLQVITKIIVYLPKF